MRKRIEWLRKEVDRWVHEGIIGPEEGGKIKLKYPLEEEISWSRVIFSSIGAILIGLGVILFFAYNWDKMHKYFKLTVVFSSILIFHGLGWYFSREGSRNRVIGEALHLLGTMLFGAGIWLVAQIYHIEEHFPNAFLIWAIGALSLAWLLPSLSHGILAAVLFALWHGSEAGNFANPNHLGLIVILAGLLPLAWVKRSRVLFGSVIAAFLISLAFTAEALSTRVFLTKLLLPLMFFMSTVLISAGLIMKKKDLFPQSASVASIFGYILYFPILYGLTFKGSWKNITCKFTDIEGAVYFSVSAILALAAWIVTVLPVEKIKENVQNLFRNGLIGVPAAIVLYLVIALGLPGMEIWGAASLFNIVFLFHSVMLILEGCRSVRFNVTVAGCLLFALVAVSRYVDLFESLLVRSIVFLVVGAALFGVSAFFARAKRGLKEPAS